MNKNRIKDVVIFLLVILTFVQIGELWFGNLSNRNFFYSFLSPNAGDVSSEKLYMLSNPYRIIKGNGDDKFSIKYSQIEESKQKQFLDSAMKELFKKGEFVKNVEMDWAQIATEILIFEYKANMPTDAFAESFGQKGSLVTSKLKNFNRIYFIPGNNVEPMKIIFQENGNEKCYEYRTTGNDLSENLQIAMEEFTVSNEEIYYVSSEQKRFDVFNGNVFLASWESDGLGYPKIEIVNPYAENGNVLLDTVEKSINSFYDDPSRIQQTAVENIYTYSDENTVVRYYPSGILECNNYKALDEKSVTSFSTAFSLAMEFIDKDTTMTKESEFYLAEYDYDDKKDVWTLDFDYTVNDMPLFVSTKLSQESNLWHAITITISHNYVTKYIRYAYGFDILEEIRAKATKGFLETLDNVFPNQTDQESEIGVVTSFDLGYMIEEANVISMYWNMVYKDSPAFAAPAD